MRSVERSAVGLLVVLALASVSFGGETESHHDEEAHRSFSVEEFEAHGVRLATAGAGVVDAGIELPAEVRPNADRLAHVAPRFPGVVREVRKNVGDTVQAGDVLAVIESDKLTTFDLRAALAGTVIDKHVVAGEAVTRDRAAYVIADLSDVWVNIAVYQSALGDVQVGGPVVLSTRDGSLEAEGVVSYIAPIVDQATRTATARVVLPNTDGRWRPGTFAVATVALEEPAAVVVPRRALHSLEGEDVMFVVEGDEFVPRPVTVGRIGRTRVEITSGLSEGDRFADENAFIVKAELAKGDGGHAH